MDCCVFSRRPETRSVLGADVVPLPHSLGGIVLLEEMNDEIFVTDLGRVVGNQHDLGMTSLTGAHLLVRRVWRESTHVPGRGRVDPGEFPEKPLGAPETAHPEIGRFDSGWEGRLQWGIQDIMTVGTANAGWERPCRASAGATIAAFFLPKREFNIVVCDLSRRRFARISSALPGGDKSPGMLVKRAFQCANQTECAGKEEKPLAGAKRILSMHTLDDSISGSPHFSLLPL